MSNYKIPGGQDLDAIFMSISTAGATGAQYATNFIAPGGDLQLRYAKYMTGLKVPNTLYVATQYYGTDLSQIFQNIAVPLTPYIINSGPSPIVNISGTLYTLTFNPNATNCSITFLANLTLTNMIIVGGGGGGRQSCLSGSNYYAGAGGGGSSFLKDGSMSVLSNTTYTYSVGSAGAGGISNTTAIANVGIQTYIHDAIGNNIVTCPGGKSSTSTNTTYSEHYWSGSGGSNSTTYNIVSITGATTGTGGGAPPGGGYKSGITRPNGGNGYNASVTPYSGGGGSVPMDVFSSGFIACLPGICGNGNIGGLGGSSSGAHTTYNAVDAISTNYGVGGGGGGGVFPAAGSTPAEYGSGGAGGPGVIQIQFNYL